jgi:hypothetical protein
VRRSQGLVLVTVVALASAAPSRPARAAAPGEADAIVDKAVALRRDGDDQGALALLLQAYALGQEPRATGQLGLCEQALGRWVDAEGYLTDALKAAPDPWVKKNRRTLEDALAIVKAHIARLEIEGEPEGAEVLVNGTLVGKLPLAGPVRVAEGEVEVEVRAPGFVRQTKTMRLEPGQYQRVIMRARQEAPEPAPATATAAPALPPPVAAPAATTAASTSTAAVSAEDKHRDAAAATPTRLALKWIAAGLGVAAVGVGVYGVITNATGVTEFDTNCRVRNGVAVDLMTGAPSGPCRDEKSRYETAGQIGVAGFVAAGLLGAAGLILWLTEPRSPEGTAHAPEKTSLGCSPALVARGGAALGCTLRF